MICKIGAKRSNDPGALIAYLFGPGKANEHVNPRTVAGSAHYPGAGKTAAPQVTADLRAIQRLWPDVKFPGGHVWHCSLSLGADEGVLPDSKWAAIADDFMQRMDFTGSGRSPVRWTAVHHGPSEAGNDHVHLVVNLVREDGTKVNIWRDMVRSQKVLQELEQRHGLSVLQSRTAGVRSVPYTAAEVARSRATGKPIERVELERIVRASAAAAPDEAAFVRLLRGSGVTVRPYPPQGAVTGYSVGLPPPADLPPRFFQGGELARDLTLPKLRANWPSSPVSTSVAEVAWRHGGPAVPVARPAVVASGIPVAPDALARALDDLGQLARDLRTATPDQLGALSRDVAGALSAAAGVASAADQPGLRKAAREVGAWAGLSSTRHATRRGQQAALLFLLAMNPDSEWAKAYMLRQLMDAVLELHRLHRAVRSVAGSVPGRGVRVSTTQDDVDGVFTDAATVAATTGATVVMHHARTRQEQLALAERLGQAQKPQRFWDRFTRQHEDALRDIRNPMPKGLQGTVQPDEWASWTAEQRDMVDPDHVGRWATDYQSATPGASLRSTADQINRADVLANALGTDSALQSAVNVAHLDRLGAARVLRKLETDLGPDATKAAYHGGGLTHRAEAPQGESPATYSIEFPPPPSQQATQTPPVVTAPPAVVTPPAAATVTPPAAPVATPPRKPSVLNDPTTWRTAGAAVKPAQRAYLLAQGHDPKEIDLLDKGHASLVVHAHKTEGDEAGHDAMDDALAAMERARQQVGTRGPAPTPPPVTPPRAR